MHRISLLIGELPDSEKIYCPCCGRELVFSLTEGCTVHHFECKYCQTKLLHIDQPEMLDSIVERGYEMVL